MQPIIINLIALTYASGQLWPVGCETLPADEGVAPTDIATAFIDEMWGTNQLVVLIAGGWQQTTDGVQLTIVALLNAGTVPIDASPVRAQSSADVLAALLMVGARWRTDPALRQALARFGRLKSSTRAPGFKHIPTSVKGARYDR